MKKTIILMILLASFQLGLAQETYFGQNKVQYRNFDWYYIQTPNFDIYFYKNEDTLATFAAKTLEDAYIRIKDQLNYNLADRVPVIIYASHNEFQQTNVISDLIPEGVGGFTEAFKKRIAIPFTGSYEDFRHVLHHELTHAVWYDLLYGDALRSVFSGQAFFSPPLWFSEGYAEYSSRYGWDLDADMFVRDAVVGGYLPPLDYLGGFLAYKGGQSALKYIAEKYGEETIPELLNKGKVQLTMDKAIKSTIGVSMEDLSDGWQKSLRRIYWPEIAIRKEPAEIAKRLTNHEKDGSLYNQKPEWSPKGDRLAFFTDRSNPGNGYSDRYNEVYIISSIDGKVIKRLVKAERSGDMESLHSYISGLAWSPDGKLLAFIGKSHGKDVLFIYDAESGHRKEKIDADLTSIRNPSWSPDGDKIAFDGYYLGFSDIYVYDLKDERLTRLMDDRYDDNDPTWSNDSHQIAFSSDRPIDPVDDANWQFGDYNIFLLNLENPSLTPIIVSPYKDIQPAFSPDGKRIAYVSNRNGIDNIYLYEIENAKTFPVTDLISGAFSPSWSPEGDQIVFSGFYKMGYDIFILKDIKNVGNEIDELALTPYMQKLRSGDKNIFVPEEMIVSDSVVTTQDTIATEKNDFSTYVFHSGDSKLTEAAEELPDSLNNAPESDSVISLAQRDTLEYKLPDGNFKQHPYRAKFSPELMGGGFSYDNFYGLRGQSYLAITDIFGNHHFYIYSDVINAIDQSNIQLAYAYTAKRIDYSASIFHFKNLYYDEYYDHFFTDRIYGLQGYAAYPLSKFSRLDLTLTQISVDRDNYDFIQNKTSNFLLSNFEYVNDVVIWGIVGPVSGHRYKLSYEQSIKATSNGVDYSAFEFDYRKYWDFWKRYNFAFRLGSGFSAGADPKLFYLGGDANWIGPKRAKGDIYNERDIYINKLVVPLRGYRYFQDSGTRYWIMNAEFRYPFIDYFRLQFPLPMTLQQVSGAIFWDMGAAWNETDDDNFFDNSKGFPTLGGVSRGFGIGSRANLGIFVLRVDMAWATDFRHTSPKPEWYFSFGAEF